ncbi:MAG: PorV/PorQ family protein [Bacteroidales bacterium]|jgi:hypothetical protein
MISLSMFAQAPIYSNEFLSIGVGARAIAMSNSNVAVVDDVTSGYWNPAGLTSITSNIQAAVMHSEYFAGIAQYDYASIAAKIDTKSTIGFSFIRFGVDDIPNTTQMIDPQGNINYDNITTFSVADYAFLVSYARRLEKIKGLNVGANVKIVHSIVGNFAKSWGFGLDAGAQYTTGKWMFGAMARDITSTFNAWSFDIPADMQAVFTETGNEIPKNSLEITLPKLILSAARKFRISDKFSLLTDIDADVTFDGERDVLIKSKQVCVDPHCGIELSFKNFIFLRGGIGNIQREANITGKEIETFQPNFGVGIKIKDIISIDYALTNIGDNSIALYSNIFSLKLNINKIEKNKN